jgi:hypothetical protein
MKPALCIPLVLVSGCTRWARTEVAGTPRQAGLVLVGEPHLEETTTTDTAEDYVEEGFDDGIARFAAGNRDRSRTTVRSTRCVQKAIVDVEQDVELRPRVYGRGHDILGGIGLALLGGIVAGVAHESYNFELNNYRSELEFHMRDPSFFPRPTEPSKPRGFYTAGAVLGLAGAGVIAFSFAALPGRERPQVERVKRRWTHMTTVDATGCR